MLGSEGDEGLAGLDGCDDVLSGGAGSDILDGGTGRDTYVFNVGDGVDTVVDAPAGTGDASVIRFGPGISPGSLELGLGSLVLGYGEGDAIHLSAFDAAAPYSTPVFERLEFDDGSWMSYQEVLELGLQISGSEADDVIVGTSLDDSIQGEDGDDMLAGGPGNDFLEGGDGNDTYVFVRGDGYD